MERKEIIDGLKDLIKDRESFITEGESESWKTDTDKIFEHDKQVLEEAINTIEAQQQEIESLIAEKDELIELLKAARSRLPNVMRFCVCGKCKSCGEQIPYTNHIYCDHCLIILIDKVIGGKEDV